MDALGKPWQHGTVFIAGEYWENGKSLQIVAQRLGCGILFENGEDLTVLPASAMM
jgi:hypothetical protein